MKAEEAWVQRHKELLERFKQRMASQASSRLRRVLSHPLLLPLPLLQGDMESFISDQIVEKLDVVVSQPAPLSHYAIA